MRMEGDPGARDGLVDTGVDVEGCRLGLAFAGNDIAMEIADQQLRGYLLGSLTILFVAYLSVAFPLMYRAFVGSLQHVNIDVENAARVFGMSRTRAFMETTMRRSVAAVSLKQSCRPASFRITERRWVPNCRHRRAHCLSRPLPAAFRLPT
ncbi:hypothetical protein AXW83_20960 [Bosea sp. PAMC 26642]|nr:hypothetical protein AXW83_20960 [Bosea sp. PAMC 26642]